MQLWIWVRESGPKNVKELQPGFYKVFFILVEKNFNETSRYSNAQ